MTVTEVSNHSASSPFSGFPLRHTMYATEDQIPYLVVLGDPEAKKTEFVWSYLCGCYSEDYPEEWQIKHIHVR
jgi:hypothetical protein